MMRHQAGIRRAKRARRNRKRLGPLWQRTISRLPPLWRALRASIGRRPRPMNRCAPAVVAICSLALLYMAARWGHGYVTTSPKFFVHEIDIRGAITLPEPYLRDLVRPAVTTRAGTQPLSIFNVDLDAAETALRAEPRIIHAEIQRRFPNGLVVEIEEHRPVAVIELDGLYLIDETGRVYARAEIERGEGRGLPIITGIDRDDFLAKPDDAAARVAQALKAARAYTAPLTPGSESGSAGRPVRPSLGEIHLDPLRGIVYFTYDTALAVRVGHGDSATLQARLRAFDRAWQALSPAERARASVVYADAGHRAERVTVGFSEHR